VQKYNEAMQKFPLKSFEKPLVTGANKSDKDGIEVINIGEVPQGKFEEAANLAVKRMLMFYGIEGVRYKIEPLMTMEEAMQMLQQFAK
jgi:hypothetical protein